MKTALKYILIGIAGYLSVSSSPAAAESRPSTGDPLSYISQLGQMTFGHAGGTFLPLPVLNSMQQNSIDPIMQFVLVNSMMTQCTQSVVATPPDIRDPYTVATQKFNYGICRLKKCFEQAMLILLLPQLTSGDSQNAQGASNQSSILSQYKNDPSCDGSTGSGIDPAILTLLAGGGYTGN